MKQEELLNVIVKNIRHFRIDRNLSQLELEHLAGLGENSLTNIENHKMKDLNLSTLNKIANALEVKITEFFVTRKQYNNKIRVDAKEKKK